MFQLNLYDLFKAVMIFLLYYLQACLFHLFIYFILDALEQYKMNIAIHLSDWEKNIRIFSNIKNDTTHQFSFLKYIYMLMEVSSCSGINVNIHNE